MSAMNLFLVGSEGHLFTDGAGYNSKTALVEGFITKVAVIPHMASAVAVTGTPGCRMLVEAAIAEMRVDSIEGIGSDLGIELKKRMVTHAPHMNNGFFDLLVVGWSKIETRPIAFFTKGHSSDGRAAFEMRKVRKFFSPNDGSIALTEIGESPARTGLALLEQQRRTKFSPLGSDALFHAVGGYAQHTIVRENEIVTRVLKRWPDEIGKVIAP